ncbi:hypothetical protein B0T19DRAFT_435452 [Cercophora scortea]|uniref:Rhodopsin domain-containing protein n=1 Tax=Cercophora scortea TaxID=314031 RepID=A0AAE0I350_9PEZI|nr:hypothetical protein B0T19DRAFT_435452 [Cercophora scortea]
MGTPPPGLDPCLIPGGPVPDGVVPNFDNPESLAAVTISVCTLTTALAVFFAGTRIFVNRRKLSWGDYCVGFAALLTIGYCGVLLTLAPYNRHPWDVPSCWLNERYMKIVFAELVVTGPILIFSKSAIFLTYYQIFEIRESTRVTVCIGLIATFCIYFPSVPLSIVIKGPRKDRTWQQTLDDQTSGVANNLMYWSIIQGALSVALDLYIFILPLPILVKLYLPLGKKIQLFCLFGIALLGLAASLITLVYRVELKQSSDSTWQQTIVALCLEVENNIAIIVASMPAFAKFTRIYIAELGPVKRIVSRIRRGRLNSSTSLSKMTPPRNPINTYGSPLPRKPPSSNYDMELADWEIGRLEAPRDDNESPPTTRPLTLEENRMVGTGEPQAASPLLTRWSSMPWYKGRLDP